MRLDLWLRAATTNLGTPNRATSTHDSPLLPASTSTGALPAATVIAFNEISSDTFAPRVFQAGEDGASSVHEIGWTKVDDEATIVDVQWVGMESRSSDFGDFETIVVAKADDGSFGDVDAPLDSVSESSAVLDFSQLDDKYLKYPMALRVDWEANSMTGYTQSSVFAVVEAGAETQPDVQDLNDFIVSMDSSSGTQTASVGSPTAGTHPSGVSPDVPSSTSNESSDTGSNDDDSSSSGGGGGLSTGAIAGIAVGAGVVVIAAIAALVWFFLRRRRQNKMHAGYAAQGTSNSFMVDKDSSHQAVAEDSPRSPYSDDGNIHQAAPYDDAGAARDAPPAGNQDVSRSVAHLVEDGMTQDEIRRLEEEERQLDAEIERAGRR